MTLPSIRYSRLRFYHFVDAKDQELGTLEDVILDQETLLPTHLILGGGFFEEYMESKGEIDDIDEIAPLELIDHIDNDYIVLNTKLEDLQTTDENGDLPIEGYKYSEFSRYPLVNPDGPVEGEIFDFQFDENNSSAILNIASLEEKLRAMGYYQKIEFQVPVYLLSIENHQVKLEYSFNELMTYVTQNSKPKKKGRSIIKLN